MNNRSNLLNQLKRLSSAQFDEVLFRLNIEPWLIPSPSAEQGLRAIALLRRLKQADEAGLKRLEVTLADSTLETIGKQYEGYEIESQVQEIIQEYLQQPFEGRREEQNQLNEFLQQNSSGRLLITADAGFGKSALLAHWQQTKQKECFVAFHCFRDRYEKTRSVSEAYRHLLRQLYVYYDRRDKQFPIDENGMRDLLTGMLQDSGGRQDKPLVIILDGLDEAEKNFDPLFNLPNLPLPNHVFVIASARAEAGGTLDFLGDWLKNAQRLSLNRLPPSAIPSWLERIEELKPYAQNENFANQIYDRTEGIPLFIKYLLDELANVAKHGKESEIDKTLAETPKGFDEYIKQQFNVLKNLDEWQGDKDRRKFFYFMTIAKGELSSADMVELMDEDPPMPWQVSRWFKIREVENGHLYSFAHAILAARFAVLADIKANTKKTQEELIRYCADWESHNSPYALRYYAEHLRDEAKSLKAKKAEERWTELYELARNQEYAAIQQEILPDEPDLPLKTIKLALQSKAEADDAGGMAEFLLLHARRKIEIGQESPLDALRAGSLERAWRLAEQFSRENCILWHLLLAWVLVTGNTSESDPLECAKKTLKRLDSIQLPRLSDWKAGYAVYLLGQILFNPEVLEFLQKEDQLELLFIQQVLADKDREVLYKEYIKAVKDFAIAQVNAGNAATALATAQQIEDSDDKASALTAIAIVQANTGEITTAQTTLTTSLATAWQIKGLSAKAEALVGIAIAQAQAGDVDAAQATLTTALTTAQQIENSVSRIWAFRKIAIAQAQVGDVDAAQATLTIALTTAQQIEDSSSQAEVLLEIAIAQAKIGNAETALKLIEGFLFFEAPVLREIAIFQAEAGNADVALITAQQIGDLSAKSEALVGIAIAQAQAGDADAAQATLTTALTTAQQIERSTFKRWAFRKIAIAQAKAGDVDAALTTAQLIKDSSDQAKVLIQIATIQAQAGNTDAAQATLTTVLTTAQQIKDSSTKSEALVGIATIQAQAGDMDAAQATLTAVLTTAQQIEDSSDQAVVLIQIATAQAQTGNTGAAQATLTTALTTAQQIEDSSDQAVVLRTITAIQAKAGDVDAALTTAQLIKYENSFYKMAALMEIVIAQAKAGDVDAALTTTQQIESSVSETEALYYKAEALKEIGIAQAKAGDADAALTTAQQIKDSFRQAEALVGIAIAQAKAGDVNAALTTAQQIKDSSDQAAVLIQIATAQAQAGNADAAQATLTTVLTTAQQIKYSSTKAEALVGIATAQANAGDSEAAQTTLKTALTTAQQIEDSSTKSEALVGIAIAQAKAELGNQAVATAAKLLSDRNAHLPKIAAAFVEMGDKEHFKQLLIPCADSLDAAYAMCGHLAKLYPQQATAIAKVVSEFSVGKA